MKRKLEEVESSNSEDDCYILTENIDRQSDSETLLSSDTSDSDNDSSSSFNTNDCDSNNESDSDKEILSDSESEDEHPEMKNRNKYDNFTIYKIVSKNEDDDNIYIGSTIDFERRKEQHRKAVDNKNGIQYYTLLYRYIRNNGGWDNFVMEKIIECSVCDKRSGYILETEYIINYKATLNSVFPITDFEERMNLI